MTDEPKAAVEVAAGALLRELDRLAASALGLQQDDTAPTDPPDTAAAHRDVRAQRERSQELVEAVIAARERASSLVNAARTLVDTVTIERIERHEWPTRRAGITLPMPSANGSQGERPDPTGEHVALTRAVAFMTEHARDPITIQDIASVSRVGVRHLQGLFRRQYGVAPMGHLRRIRLDGAHGDLRRADPTRGVTVEQIARRWQFLHLGRFASAYRDRFGLIPSRTLRTGAVDG